MRHRTAHRRKSHSRLYSTLGWNTPPPTTKLIALVVCKKRGYPTNSQIRHTKLSSHRIYHRVCQYESRRVVASLQIANNELPIRHLVTEMRKCGHAPSPWVIRGVYPSWIWIPYTIQSVSFAAHQIFENNVHFWNFAMYGSIRTARGPGSTDGKCQTSGTFSRTSVSEISAAFHFATISNAEVTARTSAANGALVCETSVVTCFDHFITHGCPERCPDVYTPRATYRCEPCADGFSHSPGLLSNLC